MSKRKQAIASKLGAKQGNSVVKKSKAAAGKATTLAGKASEAAQRVATTARGAATAGLQSIQKVSKPYGVMQSMRSNLNVNAICTCQCCALQPVRHGLAQAEQDSFNFQVFAVITHDAIPHAYCKHNMPHTTKLAHFVYPCMLTGLFAFWYHTMGSGGMAGLHVRTA